MAEAEHVMGAVRLDQVTGAAALVAAGLMLGNVLFGVGSWLLQSLDSALDVDFEPADDR